MDYKKLICRRILDLDPQYDVKKLENSSKQEAENILRRKKQESPKCIFRKNRALAPHERSAVPLGTDHCPVG